MERKVKNSTKLSTRQMAIVGMLSGISILLGITGLGFIPIPPINATIMHVPVIIGAIIEGPVVGATIGLIFGIFSIIRAITAPNILSFALINPIVSVIPRVLIGICSFYIYKAMIGKFQPIKIAVGALIGSLINTFGVLGAIYIIYIDKYAHDFGLSIPKAKAAIIAAGFTNGIPEAILSILITVPVVMAIKKVRK